MREIPLTQGKTTLVDDEDYERLSRHRWCAQRSKNGRYYAARSTRQSEHGKHGKRRRVYMHQQVLGRYFRRGDLTIDHVNGDGLDNRRDNLRVVPWGHNVSRDHSTSARSGYRGVSIWYPTNQESHQTFFARCAKEFLGTFSDPVDAALAYDLSAIDHFGECAVTNFLRR